MNMSVPWLSVGVDLVEIDRVEKLLRRYGWRFTQRVYTSNELQDCGSRVESLAARWAGKEAVAKALGAGIGQVCFKDIEITQLAAGKPQIKLLGTALKMAQEMGLTSWAISLSHDGGLALAFVVAGRSTQLP